MTESVANDMSARESFAVAAAAGKLCLPACAECGMLQYPVRDTCAGCLSARLRSTEVDGAGQIVATTELYRSNDPRFASSLPLRIASVRLDAGPLVIAYLQGRERSGRVHVSASRDSFGEAVLSARVASEDVR